jgi:excisionase family DNA binding protein
LEDGIVSADIYHVPRLDGTDEAGWRRDFMTVAPMFPKWFTEELVERAARLYVAWRRNRRQAWTIVSPMVALDRVVRAFDEGRDKLDRADSLARLRETEWLTYECRDDGNEIWSMTVANAARTLGISEGAVRQAIAAGKIRARKFGGTYLVSDDSVEFYKRNSRRRGPKPRLVQQ